MPDKCGSSKTTDIDNCYTYLTHASFTITNFFRSYQTGMKILRYFRGVNFVVHEHVVTFLLLQISDFNFARSFSAISAEAFDTLIFNDFFFFTFRFFCFCFRISSFLHSFNFINGHAIFYSANIFWRLHAPTVRICFRDVCFVFLLLSHLFALLLSLLC